MCLQHGLEGEAAANMYSQTAEKLPGCACRRQTEQRGSVGRGSVRRGDHVPEMKERIVSQTGRVIARGSELFLLTAP